MPLEPWETVGRGSVESEVDRDDRDLELDLELEDSPTLVPRPSPQQFRSKSRSRSRVSRFLSTLRSIMASWIDEKSALLGTGGGGGYVAVPTGVEGGRSQDSASSLAAAHHTTGRRRGESRCSCAVMFGLAALYVFLPISNCFCRAILTTIDPSSWLLVPVRT